MRLAMIVASAAALMFVSTSQLSAASASPTVAPAVATFSTAQQTQTQPPQGGDVDVRIGVDDTGGTVWYANPVWIAIGLLAIVIVGLVIGMAARGGDGGSTIVK